MANTTLFVLPLEERFQCHVHGGILEDPVLVLEDGRSVCKECAIQKGLTIVGSNKVIQDDISELLCYCKNGVVKNAKGVLIADSKGCDHIIKYGNRKQHEAKCEFRDDFVMINTPSSGSVENSPVPSRDFKEAEEKKEEQVNVLLPCSSKADGCFFLAESQDELDAHLHQCPCARLRGMLSQCEQRVQELEEQVRLRDEEISQLKSRSVASVSGEAVDLAKRTFDSGREATLDASKEVWEEIVRIFEELPQGLSSAKEHLVLSSAFQRSSSAVSTLKTKAIDTTIHLKQSISDIHPREKLTTFNSTLSSTLNDKLSDIHPLTKLSEFHPIDRLITLLSTLRHDMTASNDNVVAAPGDGEEDDEMKEQIAASLASYEAEQAARAKEVAAVEAAAALSLQQPPQQQHSQQQPQQQQPQQN